MPETNRAVDEPCRELSWRPGRGQPGRDASPVHSSRRHAEAAANVLLSMALTAPQYVAKAVSRKPPLLMAGRDAGDGHAADARRLASADQAAKAADDEPLPHAKTEQNVDVGDESRC